MTIKELLKIIDDEKINSRVVLEIETTQAVGRHYVNIEEVEIRDNPQAGKGAKIIILRLDKRFSLQWI